MIVTSSFLNMGSPHTTGAFSGNCDVGFACALPKANFDNICSLELTSRLMLEYLFLNIQSFVQLHSSYFNVKLLSNL